MPNPGTNPPEQGTLTGDPQKIPFESHELLGQNLSLLGRNSISHLLCAKYASRIGSERIEYIGQGCTKLL